MTSAWPFLIARGRVRDYRTVLLPDVLAGPGAASALADALPIGEPGAEPRTSTVSGGRLGPHRITAQARVLHPADIGDRADAAQFVADEHGRPLVYLFGLLSPASAPGEPDAGHLALARDRALSAYREFLADEADFAPARSGPIEVPAAAVPVPVPAVEARPLPPPPALLPPRAPRADRGAVRIGPLVGLAASAAVLLIVLVVVLGRGGSTLHDLDLVAPPDQQSCTDLRLSATVTVDSDQAVTFSWPSDAKGTTAIKKVEFSSGRHTVELSPRLANDDDRHGPLTVKAVADDGSSDSETVELDCTGG
jgi:hypothetical protein